MAWVSPKVYAILSSSEEGKDILEGIGEKSQDEVDKELDEFFGSGKGASKGADYQKAKAESKKDTEDYDSYTDEEAKEAWKTQKETQAEYENRRKNGSEGDGTAEEYERSYGEHADYKSLQDDIEKAEAKGDISPDEYNGLLNRLNSLQKEGKITDEEFSETSDWLAKVGNDAIYDKRGNPSEENGLIGKRNLSRETLVSKFNDAHLYNDAGKFQLILSNGDEKEFDTKNEAIAELEKYTGKDYSWVKDKEEKAQHGNWGITKQKSGKWRIDNTYDDYNSLEDAKRALDSDAIYGQQFTSYALTPGNKRTFLKENGLSGRYYFDGNNLIDKATDEYTGIEIDPEKGWYDKEKFLKEVESYEKHGVLPW